MKMDQEDKSEPRQSSTTDYLQVGHQLSQHGSRQAKHQERVTSSKASRNWSEEEEQLFCIFWLRKITEDPYAVVSFKNPLSRKGYNQELSDFLKKHKNQRGKPFYRSPDSCKSKYWNYNKVNNQTAKSFRKQGKQFDFVDVLLEISQGYLKGKYGQKLLQLTEEVKSTMNGEKPKSQLMKVTQEMKNFQDNECQTLYQNLSKYLKKNKEKRMMMVKEEDCIESE